VDFNAGAEVALDTYSGAGRDAMLLVVNYPTVQIASSHLSRLEAAKQQNERQPGSVPALPAGPIYTKRSGPLMVVVSGRISPGEARSLLASVNYDANVTWNEANPFKASGDLGSLVVNALILSGILMIIGLIFSFAFGGVRVLLGRLIPGKVRPPEASDFISLGLEEADNSGGNSELSSTIKAG
jgi:hypothetical protein